MLNRHTLLQLSAPLLGIFIILNGTGAIGTFVPLAVDQGGQNSLQIGVITSFYYFGMMLGAFKNASLIIRVGHIRAYAAMGALITVIVLLMGLDYNFWLWCFCRMAMGYCLAGLFIVVESWILNAGTPETRGSFLSLYMIALYSATGTGQFLLTVTESHSVLYFFICAGMLAAASIVPLAVMKGAHPAIEKPSALPFRKLFRISPSGLLSCGFAGMIYGVVLGFVPLYLKVTLPDISDTAFVMFLILVGGVLLQFPIGWISDHFDRRKMLVILCLLLIAISLIIIIMDVIPKYILYGLMFALGGISFSLYPVSMSHTCDPLKPEDIVTATQGLMLSFSLGAVSGPLLAPLFGDMFGYEGIYYYFVAFSAVLVMFLTTRVAVNQPYQDDEQHGFVAMPNTTPIVSELDPRSEEEVVHQ